MIEKISQEVRKTAEDILVLGFLSFCIVEGIKIVVWLLS